MKQNFIMDFIKGLGYDPYVCEVVVYVDKIGYYHLKIENREFKVDMQLSKYKEAPHRLNFSPVPGHAISGEVVEFINALGKSDTSKLWEELDKAAMVIDGVIRNHSYETYKKNLREDDFNDYKEGDVSYQIFDPSDWMDYDSVCDIVEGKTGVDYRDMYLFSDEEVREISSVSILRVWNEMTGRDDLYVERKSDGYYICSK